MPPKKKVCVEDPKNMVWTGAEEQLLLEAEVSFKSKKLCEGIGWGSARETYKLIKN